MYGSGWVDFWADPIVAKVYIYDRTSQLNACAPAQPSPWGNICEIAMHDSASNYLASVAYLHVTGFPTGWVTTGWDTRHVLRGLSSTFRVPDRCENQVCASTSCYTGPHLHMEACGTHTYQSLPCSYAVSPGSTWLFSFP